MLLHIVSIIANIAFFIVLNMDLYTDRAMMPNGAMREWHRSPITRLRISGESVLLYLQLVFAAVSVITAILRLFGVNHRIVKTVQLISTAASAAVFIVIMIVTGNRQAHYA